MARKTLGQSAARFGMIDIAKNERIIPDNFVVRATDISHRSVGQLGHQSVSFEEDVKLSPAAHKIIHGVIAPQFFNDKSSAHLLSL